MKTLIAAIVLSVVAAGSAHADPWKPDADIEACSDVGTMAQDQIYDCLDRLVRASNAALTDYLLQGDGPHRPAVAGAVESGAGRIP